ncbi:hypothetical protein ASPZODRAFT_22561 [Penicilliopsis zonata CBS 506.65]|uniref:Thioesterase domain-containing protein n=1 Tax=Penicilliopsis zonata CBS 506.65 TaxID=1073090 RepID=A0A1L9SRV0_9EURO|nr:hypothetical protein ASPZODRAFT_22561 [Penicilliopsis zonata CBS 506.65]OJJ49846.1 hypothetical protein ASPZODRAFT_22561 [Penicilliopsis zonata CBS 506.65]
MAISLRIESLRETLSLLSPLASWKVLVLLLAITNLKNLPLAWHVRLLYRFIVNLRLRPNAPLFPAGRVIADAKGRPTHPVFVPSIISSRTPLMETDYNLHKSNSTYFTDLDESRTALVTRLYSPGVGLTSKALDEEFLETEKNQPGEKSEKRERLPKKAFLSVLLGSVYCSFKREIKPLERYEIESRVIAWDQKWLYIASFFVRPARRPGGQKSLLASAISKYVAKKGRLTVSPERILRTSGFLPPRPATEESGGEDSSDTPGVSTPATGEGITATADSVDGSLARQVLQLADGEIPAQAVLEADQKANAASWDPAEWTWERIEQERRRGLEVVQSYAGLDDQLHREWE